MEIDHKAKAFAIGNAQYDITGEYLLKVSQRLSFQRQPLHEASIKLLFAYEQMDEAWYISKDKMTGVCAKHPKFIAGYDSIDDAVDETCSYDKIELKKHFDALGRDILWQANCDHGGGRYRLASYLRKSAMAILEAGTILGK